MLVLRETWTRYPELRFGQLLENIFGCERYGDRCIFYVDDEPAIHALESTRDFGFPKGDD